MQKKKVQKVRYDSHRVRLKTGESERFNGTYEYRWTDRYGKRQAIYARTLAELRQKEEQLIVDRHDGIRTDIRSVTVDDIFELWKDLKRGVKDNTMQNYIYTYNAFIRPSFGKNRIVMVKKTDVRRFYNTLLDGKRMKVATLDSVNNVLRQIFQLAEDDDMIRHNPVINVYKEIKKSHNIGETKRRALTIDQQKLFLDYMKNSFKYNHWYPLFHIMVNTGMRVGEFTGLRWCDVDLDKELININHTLVYYNHAGKGGCGFSINTPKTAAGVREIPMTPEVKDAFQMIRTYYDDLDIKCKSHIDGYTDFVFLNRDGKVYNQEALNRAIHRIMRDCNDEILENRAEDDDSEPVLLPDFSCHVLRHTFATRLCESGMNIKVIQNVLGHADITTTMNIYVDVTNDLKKKEMASFSQYLQGEEESFSEEDS